MTAINGNNGHNGHNGNGRHNLYHAGNGNGANGNGRTHGMKDNPGTNGHNHTVPFLDLVTPHLQLEEELISTFKKALSTAAFIGGAMVENFENSFADYCVAEYCFGV